MNHITGLEVTDNEGKFPSTLQPRADNKYDVGRPTKRWRTGEFVSVNVGTPSVEVGATLATQATSLASLDTSVTALDTRISVLEAAGGGGDGGGIEVGTKAQLLAKTGMTEGQQFFVNANLGTAYTSHENKLWTYTGRTWQVPGETVELLSLLDVIEGNTVEISGIGNTDDFQFTKTNAAEDVHVIGVVALKGASAGDWATVAINGTWQVACDAQSGQYDRANYLVTNSTDGLANESSSVSAQPFAKILENRTISIDGGLVWALLHTAEIY